MKHLMAAWMMGLLLSSVAAFAEQDSMVFVPAGEFTMGVSDLDKSNALAFGWGEGWSERITFLIESASPQRSVHVGDFFLDRYEVTNQSYFAYVVETSHRLPGMWRTHAYLSQPDQPVVGVSWADAQSYCRWANKRLPTESEWEKAARGIDARSFPWGNDWDRTRLHTADALAGEDLPSFVRWNAWREDTRAEETLRRAARVGSHPEGSSPYGAEDMAGNVWEWVERLVRCGRDPESSAWRWVRCATDGRLDLVSRKFPATGDRQQQRYRVQVRSLRRWANGAGKSPSTSLT